jgi:PAS domain S-box-containing protein
MVEKSRQLVEPDNFLSNKELLETVSSISANYRMASLKLSKLRELIQVLQQEWWDSRFSELARIGSMQDRVTAAIIVIVAAVAGLALFLQRYFSQMGRALENSESRYESLAESMAGVVYRVRLEKEWILEFMSSNSKKLFGVSATEIVGQRADLVLWWMVRKRDRQRHQDTLKRAIATREPYVIEYQVRAPDGGYLWVMERGRVVDPGVPEGSVHRCPVRRYHAAARASCKARGPRAQAGRHGGEFRRGHVPDPAQRPVLSRLCERGRGGIVGPRTG